MKLNYSEIEQTNNEIHSIAIKIKDLYSEIYQLNNIIKNGDDWCGPAADNFTKMLEKNLKNFEFIVSEIENCFVYISTVCDNYEKIEETIIKEISENTGVTGGFLNSSFYFGVKNNG